MNEQLAKRLEGIQAILMAHHRAGALLPSATKGSERETLVREFLARVFPPPFRFGKGTIADGFNAVSGQLDVVVEFPFLMSFPTAGAEDRLYLAESVAFVVEVKSALDSQWTQVEATIEKVKPLRRQWTGHLQFESGGAVEIANSSLSWIPCVAVGFTGYATADSLDRRISETDEGKRPIAALVLESGAYVGRSGKFVGIEGLLAFCIDLSYFARNILVAEPKLDSYFDKIPNR